MLPHKIVSVLNFFDCFGYKSGSSNLFKQQKLSHCVIIGHICMAALFTTYEMYLAIQMYLELPMIEVINDTLQFSFGVYTYWSIIYDSIFHRREHRQFWLALQRIYRNRFCHRDMQFRKLLLVFKVYVIIVDSAFLLNFLLDRGEHSIVSTIDYAIYMALDNICQIRICYYIFCSEVLCFQLKMIADELKSHQFKRTREYYEHIYEMHLNLNSIFGCSNVTLTLYGFYKPMTEINWFYAHFYEQTFIQYIRE